MKTCLNCEKTEEQVPLLQMHYKGGQFLLCPQCLPVLIHTPTKLADKLPGLEKLTPSDHQQ